MYIFNFILYDFREIDGVLYPGIVKEKQEAKKTYDKAKRKGQSAGHIFYKFVSFAICL